MDDIVSMTDDQLWEAYNTLVQELENDHQPQEQAEYIESRMLSCYEEMKARDIVITDDKGNPKGFRWL